MVRRFEEINGVRVPYRIVERRPGDVASCYADPSKARRELGWEAQKGLDDMVRDSWLWQQHSMPAEVSPGPVAALLPIRLLREDGETHLPRRTTAQHIENTVYWFRDNMSQTC